MSWIRLRDLPILVVDDNGNSRRILGELLTSWGFSPTVVDSGVAALEVLMHAADPEHSQRIAIIDRCMPGMDGFSVAERIQDDEVLQDCQVIMLASDAQAGDLEKCRQFGIARYMHKPVIQAELLDTIFRLTGVREAELPSPTDRLMVRLPKLKILLAEDGVVNQQVASGLLAQYGHDVVVAGDGLEAIAALEERPFDVVLMDVQMPNLDGHEATRIIRQKEQATAAHTPIIAMTAGAMKGDKERCLQSGMDAYVTKPIDCQLLLDAIEQCVDLENRVDLRHPADSKIRHGEPCCSGGSQVENITTSRQEPVASARPEGCAPCNGNQIAADVIDVEATKELCGHDEERLRVLAATLLDESSKLMTDIRDATHSKDAESLRASAHSLKGAASVFQAANVVEAALRMETMGLDGELAGLDEAYEALEYEVSRLTRTLQSFAAPS